MKRRKIDVISNRKDSKLEKVRKSTYRSAYISVTMDDREGLLDTVKEIILRSELALI